MMTIPSWTVSDQALTTSKCLIVHSENPTWNCCPDWPTLIIQYPIHWLFIALLIAHISYSFSNNNEKHRRNKQFCPHIAIVEGFIPCFLHWLVLWVIDIWKCFGLSNLNITSFCRRAILAAPNSAIFQKKYASCVLRLEMSNKTSTKHSEGEKRSSFGGEGHLKHIHIYILYMVCSFCGRTRVKNSCISNNGHSGNQPSKYDVSKAYPQVPAKMTGHSRVQGHCCNKAGLANSVEHSLPFSW